MTRTGTNLLGVMKHVAAEEYGYLGEVFDRPAPEQLGCFADGSVWDGADMWASADESAEYIMGFYGRACAHADETIGALELDAVGSVSWWKKGERETTLGAILVLMVAETARHVGQVDIVREFIDGTAGSGRNATALPDADDQWWRDYVARRATVGRTAASKHC